MQPSGAGQSGAATTRPLVTTTRPLSRLEAWVNPPVAIGVAAVYSTSDGQVEHPGRPLTRREVFSGRYHMVHLVDVARHFTRLPPSVDALPTRDDRYYFSGTITVAWRVMDPAAVVRERIVRGEPYVIAAVRRLTREISRRHDILSCQHVEDQINDLVTGHPQMLASCGIAIEQISAQISVDRATQEFLQKQDLITRSRDLAAREFQLQEETLRQQQTLESIRVDAVTQGVRGEFDLVARHLRHHPDKAIEIIQMLHDWQREMEERDEARFKNSAELFGTMVDKGLLQNIDVEEIRDGVLRNVFQDVIGTRATPDVRLRSFRGPAADDGGTGEEANGSPRTEPPIARTSLRESVNGVRADTVLRQRGPSQAS